MDPASIHIKLLADKSVNIFEFTLLVNAIITKFRYT